MEIRKILPDPDLHYGIKPEDKTNTIQKAPQRPRKARRATETPLVVSEDQNEDYEDSRGLLDPQE